MHKNCFTVLFTLLLLAGCAGDPGEYPEEGVLKGSVRSIEETTIYYPDNTPNEAEQLKDLLAEFSGMELDETAEAQEEELLIFKSLFRYDSLGRVTEQYDFEDDIASGDKTVYEYKGDNRLEDKRTSYDESGKIISITEVAAERPGYRKTFTHNEKRTKIREVISEWKKGNLEELIIDYSNDNEEKITVKGNYKNGVLRERTMFLTKNLYEGKHQVISTYNEKGDIVSEQFEYPYDPIPSVYSYTYEYDKKGNWIKRTCTSPFRSTPDEITERKITYND